MRKADDYWFEFWATVIVAMKTGSEVHNPIINTERPFGVDLCDLDDEQLAKFQELCNQIDTIFNVLGDSEYADPAFLLSKLYPLLNPQPMHESNIAGIFADLSVDVDFNKELERETIVGTWQYNNIVPQDVYAMLDAIYKNESVKRMVSTAIYNHFRLKVPSVNLIIGQTASGKTQIFRELSKVYDIIRIIDSTKVQNTGFSKNGGIVLSDLFKGDHALNQIFVWDEFDKICTPLLSSNHGDVHRNLMNELLKIFSGDPIQLEGMDAPIKDYRVTHFLLGTFEHILKSKREDKCLGFGAKIDKSIVTSKDLTYIDLYQSGLSKELIGRINGGIAYMDTLTESDIVSMLEDPHSSPVWKLQKRYHKYIRISDARKQQLAKDCLASGLGIRYIENEIIHEINNSIFDNPDKKAISM